MKLENSTAQEELNYIQSEANKIEGLNYFKTIVNHTSPEIKHLLGDTIKALTDAQIERKSLQLKNKTIKSVIAVKIEIQKETVYSPIKADKNTGYGASVGFVYRKGHIPDESLNKYLRAVKMLLDMNINTILNLRFKDYLRDKKLKITKGKFKKSGHLVDQNLKYNYPKDKSPQLKLFESLKGETQQEIKNAEVEISEVVEGIKLSPSETKIVDSLCKLLHHNSQTTDPKKEDYYSGNQDLELTAYGVDKTALPKLAITLYELTKEYKGEDYVSGKDIENVKQILTELDKRKFLIRYKEETKGKGGEWIKKEYESFRPLIYIDKATLSYGVKDVESYKREETVIVLNPIFTRQIGSKWITYPNDINRRSMIAYGSHNISEITLRLRDYLLRELSSKHYQPEVSLDRLYHILAEKWMKESRKKKVKQYTDKALETVKALGLLISYEEKRNVSGEPKIVFKLNKDWE